MNKNKDFHKKIDQTIKDHGFNKKSHPFVKLLIVTGLTVSLISLVNKFRASSVNNFKSHKI